MRKFLRVWAFVGIQFIVSAPAIADAPDTLWTRTYGGTSYDYGYSVQECAGGGFIIAGRTWSFGAGYFDVYLIRTNADGDTLWTKTYGGTSSDRGRSVQECAGGGFIIAGYTQSPGRSDVYLIKTNSDGDTLWTKTYSSKAYEDRGLSVQECASGGFILAGKAYLGTGYDDVYLIRTDAQGDTLWTRIYGGTNQDIGWSVQECADSGFIIAGYTESFGAGLEDVYLIRTNSDGDTLWTKTYGGTNNDRGRSVQQTTDGGYIITGWTESFGAGEEDVWLIKTDVNGDTLWTKTFGDTLLDYGYSVQQTTDGGYIITGWTRSYGAGKNDVWLIKTDANGDKVWDKTFGGTDWDEGWSVQQTTDGGYIITGYTESFGAGLYDVWLIRVAPEGVGVEEHKSQVTSHKLQVEVCPNPSTTLVRVQWLGVSEGQKVSLKVYDLGGRLVKTLLNNEVISGNKIEVRLDELTKGIYFVKMEAHTGLVMSGFTATKKIILMR